MTGHHPTVQSLYDAIDALWPFSRAEDWDQVGLIVGGFDWPVTRVLLVVDVTEETVDEAVSGNYDAMLAHHPLLLKGITTVAETTSKGALVSKLIRANCALIAAHTNADKPSDGVADVLAEHLGLRHTRPIEVDVHDERSGIGRVGLLDSPIPAGELAHRLAAILPETATGVRLAGSPEESVQRVALCPGAGDSLLNHPEVCGADVFITADLRHHPASESRALSGALGRGPALIDVSHWASEWLWLDTAARILSARMPSVDFTVSALCTDVWTTTISQHDSKGRST